MAGRSRFPIGFRSAPEGAATFPAEGADQSGRIGALSKGLGMKPEEAPQKPSVVTGSIWLALACLFAYYRARVSGSSDAAYTLGSALGSALLPLAVLHFAIARK